MDPVTTRDDTQQDLVVGASDASDTDAQEEEALLRSRQRLPGSRSKYRFYRGIDALFWQETAIIDERTR